MPKLALTAFKLLCLCFLMGVTGCSSLKFPGVHRIPILQGNIIDQKMVDQLKLGMSKRQVRYVMGTPLVKDTFNPDRWDYYYRLRLPAGDIQEKRFTAFFEDNKLVRFTGDLVPATYQDKPENQEADIENLEKETVKTKTTQEESSNLANS